MRAFIVVIVNESVEALLLTTKSRRRGTSGLGFERAMHSLVSAILLGMAWDDPFDRNSETDPPQREAGKPCQAWRSERTAVVREDRTGQAIGAEHALEGTSGMGLL